MDPQVVDTADQPVSQHVVECSTKVTASSPFESQTCICQGVFVTPLILVWYCTKLFVHYESKKIHLHSVHFVHSVPFCSIPFSITLLHMLHGCSLSPILFSVFINGLLKEVEQAELGIELSKGAIIGGMLFADDFVGVSDSGEELQKLIDVVHAYCCKWRLKANVSKSAVMVFARDAVEGDWKWGENSLPKVCKYTYLGSVMGLGMRI